MRLQVQLQKTERSHNIVLFINQFGFRWTVFGFYWLKSLDPSLMDMFLKRERQERLLQLYVACTVGMLRVVYGHNAMLLR